MNDILTVKAGDEVIFSPPGLYSRKRIEKVERVTPTGRIKVCGEYFNERGCQIGGDTWRRYSIMQATPEEILKIKHDIFTDRILSKLSDLKSLTYEQAAAINAILSLVEQIQDLS